MDEEGQADEGEHGMTIQTERDWFDNEWTAWDDDVKDPTYGHVVTGIGDTEEEALADLENKYRNLGIGYEG
jgi:hypothetical protein